MDVRFTDIFRFLDYASWLRAEYEAWKEADPSFSHRSFSRACGYRSSGALALVMSGRRNLSRQGAARVANALGLDAGERAHLMRMLDFEQADDFAARAAVMERMKSARRFSEHWQDTIDAYAFYEDWRAPLVRELLSLDDWREDPEWMASRIHARVTPAQCAKALALLIEQGHVERDGEGRLRPTHRIVATQTEARSDALKAFQKHMMALAADALDTQEPDRRDMRVVTMAISQAQAARIKALLVQTHKEVLAIVAEDEPIEAVYQLNTQLFALTDPAGGSSGEAAPGGGTAEEAE
jgi:uncharacterized protein (TIGR02147 family)